MDYKFSNRMNLLKGSEIRELMALTARPEVISFAGGMPAPELFPVEKVKEACGKDFITVTPGIRLASNNADDQVRITTPKMAREIGSDFIVVGRPITQAENPVEAYHLISKEFLENE